MNQFIKNYLQSTPNSSISSSISSLGSIDSMNSVDFTYSSDNETSQLRIYKILYKKYINDIDFEIKKMINTLIEIDFNPTKKNKINEQNIQNKIEILKQQKIEYEELNELIEHDSITNDKLLNNLINFFQQKN